MEAAEGSVFAKLQPICVRLARDGCIEDIDRLQEVIKEIDKESLLLYQEYIIFPFRLLLSKKPHEKLMIRVIDFLTYLFDRSDVFIWDIFSNVFVELVNLITNLPDPEKVCDASEELKLSVCHCISSLVRNADDKVLYAMYDQAFRLILAQAFFVFVQLLKHEKSKSLRQTLLETIGVLAHNTSYQPWRSSKTQKLASKSLTHFFPGLSSALMSIICGDIKQGQNVLRLALSIFSELIALVMSDKCYDESFNTSENVVTKTANKSKLESVTKDESWFKETATVLKKMMTNMKVLVTHYHWKVRLEFLSFVDSVLCSCTKTLENCIPVLLPLVFSLSVDTHQEISSYSSKLILKFSQKFQCLKSKSLLSLIKEDIHLSTSNLIKSKFSSNDSEKLTILRTIHGYIKIFGRSDDNMLSCYFNLERVLLSLINILEFDIVATNLVEDISLPEQEDFTSPMCDMWPKKKFVYFQSEEVVNTASNICCYIGMFANVRLAIDYLFEKLHSSKHFELQCIFLIGRILEGIVNRKQTENNIFFIDDTVTELLHTLEQENPTYSQEILTVSTESNIPNKETYSNHEVHKICLILETIGKSAKVLRLQFRTLLMRILFPVLEQAGSSNYVISKYGQICLYTVAHYCVYSSVRVLVKENVDYIMNSLSLNFHHFVSRPEMAVVLSVVLNVSNAEILPLCKDSMYHLFGLLDCNQDKAYMLLKVLGTIVQSIKKWFLPREKSNLNASASDSNQDKDLKAVVLTYKESITSELNDVENDASVKENSNCFEESDSVPETEYNEPPPLHISITSEVLKRCSHLHSINDLQIKVLSLEVMESCILILGEFEFQLHPVVHELWPRFIWRFNDESVVCLTAFKVLLAMADECREFVRTRVLKDVAGKLISFLKKNSANSLKHNFRNYQWQNTCKLHLCILSEMGSLFTKIDVGEKDIAQLGEVCLPYLNKSQSKVFQEAAYKTVTALATLDPDAMWLYYNILYCESECLTPPHNSLYTLHFPNSSNALTEFKFNCKRS